MLLKMLYEAPRPQWVVTCGYVVQLCRDLQSRVEGNYSFSMQFVKFTTRLQNL